MSKDCKSIKNYAKAAARNFEYLKNETNNKAVHLLL